MPPVNLNSATSSSVLSLETIKPSSPLRNSFSAFYAHKTAMAGLVGLVLLIAFIVFGTLFIPESQANKTNLRERLEAPSITHLFGTDNTGRDQFARIIYGGLITLVIGVLAVVMQVALGTIVGGISGYYGGAVDSLLMRFTEAMLSIPSLFLLIVLGKYFGRDIQTMHFLGRTFSGSVPIVVLVIGATSWMTLARITRAEILSLRESEYVMAAEVIGARKSRILFKHLIPNAVSSIIVAGTLGLANAVIMESYVSFLGLGVQPPTATWGNMMTDATTFIQRGLWWMWVVPGFFIVYTIICFNLVGDGLRDALDPKNTKRSS